MAPLVQYEHALDYVDTPRGPVPALVVLVSAPSGTGRKFETIAHLDTGAERSLFDGDICVNLGLSLFSGRKRKFNFTGGGGPQGWEHSVAISHPALGSFDLEVSFSGGPITRNLLGRDFMNLIQIGFRERLQSFYVTVQP